MRYVLSHIQEAAYCTPNTGPNARDEWAPDTALKKMLEWFDLQYEHSLELDLITAFGNEPILTYYLLQDKDYFFSKKVDDGLPENLAAVATAAVNKYITNFPDVPRAADRVKMNMLVEKIDWKTESDTVLVTAKFLDDGYDATPTPIRAKKVCDIEN
jgi:hypothetical protein